MYVAIKVNGETHTINGSLDTAITGAISLVNKMWEDNTINSEEVRKDYIAALNSLTLGRPATFLGKEITLETYCPKKFSITYTQTFEECTETIGERCLSKQQKFVCVESAVKDYFSSLRNILECDVEGLGDSFDTLVQRGDVECLQDTEWVYEAYSKLKHKFYIIEVKELD